MKVARPLLAAARRARNPVCTGVENVRTSRVSCFVIVKVAPGALSPVVSDTRPDVVPLELCARTAPAAISCSAKEDKKRRCIVETESRRLTAFLQVNSKS